MLRSSMFFDSISIYSSLRLKGIKKINQKLEMTEFVPIKDKLIHIIWNVYLIDKQTKMTPEIVSNNKVGYILAILPTKDDLSPSLLGGGLQSAKPIERYKKHMKDVLNIPYHIMEYHQHEPILTDKTLKEYQLQGQKIDQLAKGTRRNVFIFCNNGFQRSLPFICYYLIKYHPEEVDTVERAIDLILPQVSKQEYMDNRDRYVNQIKQLNLGL